MTRWTSTVAPFGWVALLWGVAWAGAPPGPEPAPRERPLYFERTLTSADLADRTLRELSLMRNTIFARVGNRFRKDWLDTYFRAQPWYVPRATTDTARLTSVDRHNAKAIALAESQIPRAELERRAAAIRARAATPRPHDPLELRLISARLGKWVGGDRIDFARRSPLEDPSMLDTQLKRSQLDQLSRRDLRMLRNTIFARRGYGFKSRMLQEYFGLTDWYAIDPAYTPKKLSRVDWRNVKLIKSIEHSLGGPLTDAQHAEEDGWFFGA